jgi:hypothetical protein
MKAHLAALQQSLLRQHQFHGTNRKCNLGHNRRLVTPIYWDKHETQFRLYCYFKKCHCLLQCSWSISNKTRKNSGQFLYWF